ncbi:MAG: hypothetical protein ACOYNZ_12670 [Rhodoferax sp.]
MKRVLTFIVVCVWFAAHGSSDKDTYTLYRSSVANPKLRVLVAVYDAPNGKNYNTQKCRTAQGEYQQLAVAERFWCEQGRTGRAS